MSEIVVCDQVGAQPQTRTHTLEWGDGVPMTVRDLITERVKIEYDYQLVEREDYPEPLVNLPRKPLQAMEKIIAKALEGFVSHNYLVIVDDHQVEGLDDIILLKPKTEVIFLRLVPLVGG